MKYTKTLLLIYDIILIIFIFAVISCSPSKRIHNTGTYVIKTASVSNNGYQEVTFTNYVGKYLLQADTLKAGDTIKLNVIKLKR